MTKFTAIATERNAAILNVAGGGKALEVLCFVLGPTLSKLGTTRLAGELNGENILAIGIANQVDDGHVLGHLLFLGDEEDTNVVLAQGLLDGGKIELVHDSTGVSFERDAESIKILRLSSVDQGGPSLPSIELRDTGPVDDAAGLAVNGFVASLIAKLAFGIGAVAREMAFLAA